MNADGKPIIAGSNKKFIPPTLFTPAMLEVTNVVAGANGAIAQIDLFELVPVVQREISAVRTPHGTLIVAQNKKDMKLKLLRRQHKIII
jgi:hypothetical protein